jgi:hypothetical protein
MVGRLFLKVESIAMCATMNGMMAKAGRRPTTPEEEGVEFHPDAWERFERTVEKVVTATPAHRTGKKAGADQRGKRASRRLAKPNG